MAILLNRFGFFSRYRLFIWLLAGAVILSAGCFQQISKEEFKLTGLDPTTVPTPTPTLPPPTPTLPRPTPTQEATPMPTVTVTPTITPTPELVPTPIPTPTMTPGLFMEIDNPDNNISVSTSSVTVSGRTLPTAVLEINSTRVTVGLHGEFLTNIFLRPGQNVIELIVTGQDGIMLRDFIIIRYNPPLPFEFFLLVDNPSNDINVVKQIIQVSGSTSPVATVRVNGEKVSVEEDGKFFTFVQLQPGSNNIKISSASSDGKILTDTRKVFYVP
ncbi:MAG: hypothetical protein VX966_01810 [Chloroflexota bacterium]|nr:hypothetical protein [Chloroflexota bacterium]